MNRTIKFRGQIADIKEWVYGYYVITPTIQHRIYWKPFDDATSNTYHIVIPETVGQFTGLTDKNGKEIYEGDTIKGGIYLSYDVEWDYEQNGWNIGCGVQSYYQVIGNIHDK